MYLITRHMNGQDYYLHGINLHNAGVFGEHQERVWKLGTYDASEFGSRSRADEFAKQHKLGEDVRVKDV